MFPVHFVTDVPGCSARCRQRRGWRLVWVHASTWRRSPSKDVQDGVRNSSEEGASSATIHDGIGERRRFDRREASIHGA